MIIDCHDFVTLHNSADMYTNKVNINEQIVDK